MDRDNTGFGRRGTSAAKTWFLAGAVLATSLLGHERARAGSAPNSIAQASVGSAPITVNESTPETIWMMVPMGDRSITDVNFNSADFEATLQAMVTSSSGAASADFDASTSYCNLSSYLNDGVNPAVTATLLEGVAGGDETATVGTNSVTDLNSPLTGLSLSGADQLAMKIGVPLAAISVSGLSPSSLQLMWYDMTNHAWVYATEGNGLNSPTPFRSGNYDPNADFALDDYGFGTDGTNANDRATVDHNRDFNRETVPEPITCSPLCLGSMVMLARHRKKY